ncbi:nucleotidyl transferase AbiEii/AbiGii toxin family protein [Serratia marcescens]|uniref:nucleotidyl transferase AbiEii/AbiGii toxin family protein n=1 Tax=Serratia marcescens TaxID=615 RepID=UPI001EF07F9A|nr:nucleotidyl transferase AbiEii/AbiGii toxin family protein [Serratia marcescens]ULH11487.1 nucleotidyl transferase AbiEii/AbiGii toxin family protein [Serratia marcescens]
MDDLTTLFSEVADALGIESVAIVEKDHYILELLALLKPLSFCTHQLVFAGGTALAKSGVLLNRMSEDVDIKMVPTAAFLTLSRTRRKTSRKAVIQSIIDAITATDMFSVDDGQQVTRDEYRYNDIPVRYPQRLAQEPCLRPFIKLELMEADLLEPAEARDINSLATGLLKKPPVVQAFPSVTVTSTQAEKLVAMLRRTAAVIRNVERFDDTTLVRHIYDTWCIMHASHVDMALLPVFVERTINQDIQRYGNQYPQFCDSPVAELKLGLEELENNPVHKERYQQFVAPMVFGKQVTWVEAYGCFRQVALSILDTLPAR